MSEFLQVLRSLAKRPGYSAAVILIIALCIGGNAAFFGAGSAILLKSLPFKDSDRLAILTGVFLPAGLTEDSLSYLEVKDIESQTSAFQAVTPFLHWTSRVLVEEDSAEQVRVNFVGARYFDLLGFSPVVGRTFDATELKDPGQSSVVLISHDLWERHYAKDPRILGKKIQLNRAQFEVIGVMPPDFRDIPLVPFLSESASVWLPAAAIESQQPGVFTERTMRVWFGVARLKPGMTLKQARVELNAVAERLRLNHPDSNKDYGIAAYPFDGFVLNNLQTSIWTLLLGSLFVLGIGCASIANLLLVGAGERRREMAMRAALGASHWQLMRRLLTESLILAVCGGVLGVFFSFAGVRLLREALELPHFVEISMNAPVLIATFALTLLTGLLFGLPAAKNATRLDLRDDLQERNSTASTRATAGQNFLIVLQVASAVILLVGSGLLLRSFLLLHGTNPDYPRQGLLVLQTNLGHENYREQDNIRNVNQALLERIRTIPGVEAAGVWGPGTLGRGSTYVELLPEGAEDDALRWTRANRHHVSPGAIRVMQLPLLKGRDLSVNDTKDTPHVALVSQSMAEAVWPNQDPLGKRFRISADDPWITVVGVIAGANLRSRLLAREHDFLISYQQMPIRSVTLLVRTTGDPAALAAALREAVRDVDPRIPVFNVATVEQVLAKEEAGHRLNAILTVFYAALALFLAVMGVFAVISNAVLQRTREIGLRVALGAHKGGILKVVVSRSAAMVGIGLGIGILASLFITRLISKLLFNVPPNDALTFVGASLLLLVVMLLASAIPAQSALSLDPAKALRKD